MNLFCTAFTQIFLVATNTVFLSKGFVPGVVVSSFGINWIWTYNVRKTVISTTGERLYYAIGATAGCVCGYYASQFISTLL